MSRLVIVAFLIASALASSAAAQFNSETGRPNDPSTYQGSVDNERQMQSTQQHLDQAYSGYGQRSGGGGGGGGRPSLPPLKSKPLLPAAKNPLLGMWRMGVAKRLELNPVLKGLGADVFVNGALGGVCESMLGKPDTVIRFTATQLNWVAPDGHDEILNKVEYRSDGGNVIVIAEDGAALIFGMPNHDNALAALYGCRMSRTNTSARLGQPPAGGGNRGGTANAPTAAVAAGQAVLNLTVGQVVNGALSSPPAGTQIFVTRQNPDANLVNAGFAGPQPVESLFAACKSPAQGGDQERCNAGMKAMLNGALGFASTDPNGHAQSGAIPPGRYYLVGSTRYQGHSLLWHMPVDLKTGANSVSLTPQNGSISH